MGKKKYRPDYNFALVAFVLGYAVLEVFVIIPWMVVNGYYAGGILLIILSSFAFWRVWQAYSKMSAKARTFDVEQDTISRLALRDDEGQDVLIDDTPDVTRKADRQ